MNRQQAARAELTHTTIRRMRTATLVATPEEQNKVLAEGHALSQRLGRFIFHAEQHTLTIKEQFSLRMASIKYDRMYRGYQITSQVGNTSNTAVQRAASFARNLIQSIAEGDSLRLSDDIELGTLISREGASAYIDTHPNWVAPLTTDAVYAEIACLGLESVTAKRPKVYPAVTSADGSRVIIAHDAPADCTIYVDLTSEQGTTSTALARGLGERALS